MNGLERVWKVCSEESLNRSEKGVEDIVWQVVHKNDSCKFSRNKNLIVEVD